MTRSNLKISVLSYFFISFVLGGLQRLSGLFVLELLMSMSLSRQNAAVPFTFSWAVANIMASLSDCLRECKKSEYVILLGILLTATGAALCLFATNVTSFIIFWGFIFGSGYGIAFPHISRHVINVKCSKLSFLLQVAPSLGVTVLPFVLHMLTTCYGLQGSYLIIAGIILNYLPLSAAAAYNIELRLPNFKWRVRKKSSQYSVSKQETKNVVSVESFVNSLEPDLILKINPNDECTDEIYSDIDNSVFSPNEVFNIGRKRSDTRGYDLPGLEMYLRTFSRNETLPTITDEAQKCESNRHNFEDNINNKDITRLDEGKKESKSNCIITCDTNNTTKMTEKYISNVTQKSDLNSEDNIQQKGLESEIAEKKESSERCLEYGVLPNDCKQSETEISLSLDYKNRGSTPFIIKDKEDETDSRKETDPQTVDENNENVSHLSSEEKSDTEKVSTKDPKHNSDLTGGKLNIPLNIKAHVEEYTFICEEESWHGNLNIKSEKDVENSYKNHSNSVLSEIFANIDFMSPKFSKNLVKTSDLFRPKLSSIYSISQNSKFYDKQIEADKSSKETEQNKSLETLKVKRIFKFLNKITSPGCICIILINIIFEMNLITLVTMFADFGSDIDNHQSDFKWILVAFGAGGIAGRFCCCKISRTIPERSHAIGVILFLLNGLSTAGVLFSTNLNWLSSFYAILGALEGGITYIIPKFILEFIDKDMHSTLYSVKSFLSGLAIISIPYVIGLCRDELGDYEFLLQTLSCSSILCAFLVYFLPCLSLVTEKRYPASFRDKMEMA